MFSKLNVERMILAFTGCTRGRGQENDYYGPGASALSAQHVAVKSRLFPGALMARFFHDHAGGTAAVARHIKLVTGVVRRSSYKCES